MKRALYLMIGSLLILGNSLCGKPAGKNGSNLKADSVSIFAAPGLVRLSSNWAKEYNRLYPGAHIRVITVADQKKEEELIREGSIGFTAGDFIQGNSKESFWNQIVGRDVIVPVINTGNPFMEEIVVHGVAPDALAAYFKSKNSGDWGVILKNGRQAKADLLYPGDEQTIKSIAAFLKAEEATFSFDQDRTSASVLSAVQKDPYAIGFCKLADAIHPSTQQLIAGIRLLPVDRNGNGVLDFNEKIYDNVNDFTRGVWIGKYPRILVSNIYTVAARQPENSTQLAFLRWVIADGQKFLPANGFTDLLASERQGAADRLNSAGLGTIASSDKGYLLKSLLFILAIMILMGVLVSSVVSIRKGRKTSASLTGPAEHTVLDQERLMIPKGIYFDKTHTWAFMEENGTVKVGIDDFLQHITGKITRIRMKEPGKKVKKGEEILSIIQNGKQLSLYAPVSGTIVEQNTLLEGNSAYLNSAPYSNGWIYRIEPSNWIRESQLLFMAEKQREFIKKEFIRLKDFLMKAQQGDPGYAQLLLQDGGEIADGVLSGMGPEVWEDFQTSFIDPSRQVWFYEIF